MPLYPKQNDLVQKTYGAWRDGAKAVMVVSPTGSGKTTMFTHIHGEFDAPSIATAHRQELVGQISTAFTRMRVPHRIIAPQAVIRTIVGIQQYDCGYSSYNPGARVGVAGIDTLIRMSPDHPFIRGVWLHTHDEAHHVLRDNKWGKGADMFRKDAYCLLPTATPERADGKGLGREADGIADILIEGATLQEHIDDGTLTNFRYIAAPNHVDLSEEDIGASGEFVQTKLVAKVRDKSAKLIGDIVEQYQKWAPGKLAVCFAVDIEEASKIQRAFTAAGVAAQLITGKSHDTARAAILRDFKSRRIQVLINVDLFGEGFDLPACECVILARPTNSFGLYTQQVGRGLRLMVSDDLRARWGDMSVAERLWHISQSEKPQAIIIDHVNNWARHNGTPAQPRVWSLARRERRASSRNVDPEALQRACLNPECFQPYKRYLAQCPYCGSRPTPASRNSIELVEGDLTELDPAFLASLHRGIDPAPTFPAGAGPEIVGALRKHHFKRQHAQQTLRERIALWAGYQRHRGLSDSDAQRLFYLSYGVDLITALKLNEAQTVALDGRMAAYLDQRGVVAA